MCRNKVKDQTIDNSLCFAYARLDKLADMEEFISNPNSTDYGKVGDRCFKEKLYEAAKILYT